MPTTRQSTIPRCLGLATYQKEPKSLANLLMLSYKQLTHSGRLKRRAHCICSTLWQEASITTTKPHPHHPSRRPPGPEKNLLTHSTHTQQTDPIYSGDHRTASAARGLKR
jgi:hypothetical protein